MSRIVVLGGGESGVGSAVLAKVKGFDVFLSDRGNIAEKYVEILKNGTFLSSPDSIRRIRFSMRTRSSKAPAFRTLRL